MMNLNNRAAIYCRLSKDDEQSGDSVSIETQRMMLTKYCTENKFEIFDIYVDDGYSGLNFNRPSFKRLIRDLEDGQFNIVITKDLSRLGRDYIQTGYYIDVYFVTKRVRYIAVNDGIDTKHENNDIAPFKNILNDMYAKDLSRKVKSAKQQRAQNGLYISAQPPYGYKVNPHNRNQLIIDEEAAENVKIIFELANSGLNYSEISKELEQRKIISPSVYKAINGDTRFLKFMETEDKMYRWPYQTIKSIIANPVYVGDMVNHKVETINYKTKERVRIPIEEQIIVRDKHEPIIDRDVFETINKRLSNRRKPNHKYNNVLKGLVFCDECGEELQLISKNYKSQSKLMFRCPKHIINNRACTHNHYIYYDDLITEIRSQLTQYITNIIASNEYDDLCEKVLTVIYDRVREIQKSKLQKELLSTNKSIKESYIKAFSNQSADESNSLYIIQKQLMQKMNKNSSSPIEISATDLSDVKRTIQEFLITYSVSEKQIGLFVKKIEIGYLERSPLGTHQRITIHYNF